MDGNVPPSSGVAVNPPAPEQMANQAKNSSNREKVLIGVVGIIVVLLILGTIFFDQIKQSVVKEQAVEPPPQSVADEDYIPVSIYPTIDPMGECTDTNNLGKALQNVKVVCGLDLSNQNFSTLPDEIVNLTKLESINLSYNNFTTLPEQLGKMPTLKKVNLSNNKISKEEEENIRSKYPSIEFVF